jgi:hypothetical protein
MLAALRHIELVKLALMHSLEILHMKQDSVHAVSMLMQSVQTTPAPRSAEEGAECAVWLATREFSAGDTTGVLWEDRQIVEW